VASTEKVAISVDRDVLRRAERLRRATGETRSALFTRALRLLVAEGEHAMRVKEYVAAYRAQPERVEQVDMAHALAARSFASIPWESE
jgi:metal-responsive CopG/Arc/MetJ family transcriptional regulator